MKSLSIYTVLMLVGSNALAVEPERALPQARGLAEDIALRQISEDKGILDTVLVQSGGKVFRGKFSAGEFSDFMGHLEVMVANDETGDAYTANCSVFISVKKDVFRKRDGRDVILEEVVNEYQLIARPQVVCRDIQ